MTLLNIEADAGVSETWLWTTDIMEARDGSEQRLSLQPAPDVIQTLGFTPLDQPQRGSLAIQIATNLGAAAIVPLFGWSAQVTAAAGPTDTIVQCNTQLMALNENDYVYLVNFQNGEVLQRQASSVTDSSVTLATQLGVAIDTGWTAFKGMNALLQNEGGFSWQSEAGAAQLVHESFEKPWVQRTGAVATLNTFNGLPLLEREALEGVTDAFELVRDVTRFNLGRYNVFSARNNARIIRQGVRFLVNRTDTEDIDYWRLFLDTTRGSWKAFLVSSQLEDITLASPLTQGGLTLQANEQNLGAAFLNHASFANFQIEYSDGTTSEHTASNESGGLVTFAPALPNDPKVANVERISYLLKARVADRQQWTHGGLRSALSFDMTTTTSG